MELLQEQTIDLLLVRNFVIALFIGALIGVERQRHAESDQTQFGGLRTFTLCALFGALAGELAMEGRIPALLVAGLLGLIALLGITVYIEGRVTRRVPGLTTELAAVVTYLLGGAVTIGHPGIAVMLAIATFAVLTFKQPMHSAVRALAPDDIVAGLKLLAATFIVLPLIPDRALDPWGAFNPWKLWLLVLLISGLSLVGYVAVRLLGTRRGFVLTGLFGGLASSTAVTLSFARRSREDAGVEDALTIGILLAWAVMFVRVLIEVAVVNPDLLLPIMPPMAAMFAACAVLTWWFHHRAKTAEASSGGARTESAVALKNPFSLSSAIQFGLFFAAILFLTRLAQIHLPANWLYAVAALAGSTDVDAITLSLAQLARGELEHGRAVLAILIAAWTNTVLKCALVMTLGSRAMRRRIAGATLAIVGAGVVAALAW
jgi:uncharacterized membrane protein (DUF4010 family)